MDINFKLKELDGSDIPEDKVDLLKASLNINDDSQLQPILNNLAQASLADYIEMLVGKGMPNRADESKQDRLLYLIKKVYSPRLPGEDEISMMFQLTSTQSKTLLRNTLSRYRTKLSSELNETLENIFRSAIHNKEGWEVTISSEIFVEQLNLIVAKEGPEYNPVKKRSVGTRKYFIAADTHTALGNHFGN